MDEQLKKVLIVGIILSLLFAGVAIAYVLKTYQMNAVTPKTNLKLYYNSDLNDTHVIYLENFNWTATTGILITNGTVLDLWARNEGNQAANFTFQILNTVNCTVVISPAALPINFQPGSVAALNLTLTNVQDNPSWQITVNY